MSGETIFNHPKLNLRFKKKQGGIVFEDNVFYSKDEIDIIKDAKPLDCELKTLHDCKLVFGAIIIENTNDTT